MASKISIKVDTPTTEDTTSDIMEAFEEALDLMNHTIEDIVKNFYTLRFDIDDAGNVGATITSTKKKD